MICDTWCAMNIFLPWRVHKNNIKLCAEKFWGKHMFLQVALVIHWCRS
uniref:Uncharacterized protein n=1 Tax=Arundo donax TaxID=35708 RepID=A0A0A9DQ89_ARUDO